MNIMLLVAKGVSIGTVHRKMLEDADQMLRCQPSAGVLIDFHKQY